jgi:hypothetical protein
LATRRWVEQKLKANELLVATRRALADCGRALESAMLAAVEKAMLDVSTALATESPATGNGDLKALQSATAKLDEMTRPLAELLMDRAMEAMLRRRGAIS